ncbi:MAG: SLOG family protein [Candidatus Caccovivens sp.]
MCKVCSFFGHRKIEMTEELKQKVRVVVEGLILNHSVSTFLFGSRSDFDYLCHLVVTELKEKYPKIKRIAYTCGSESCTLESERLELEKLYSKFFKQEVSLLGVEEEREYKTKYTSGRASYVERNQAMIDDSDYCVFYYDENYKPEMRKYSKRCACYYQPKSGTALAYAYAKQKRKIMININFAKQTAVGQ